MEVQKYPLVRMNQDDDDAAVKPGEYRSLRNMLCGVGLDDVKRKVPGMEGLLNVFLPSGNNTVIGQCNDQEENRVIFFVHNSLNNHTIFLLNEDGTIDLLLQSSVLNFSASAYIVHADINQGVLYFTDGVNPVRQINIGRALASGYTPTEEELAFIKYPPQSVPTASFGSNAGEPNKICSDGWQFCVQYVYKDNEVSMLGPLSALFEPLVYPDIDDDSRNKVSLSYTIESAVLKVVKKIRFVYRKNNFDDFFVFNEQNVTTAGPYSATFTNSEVSTRIGDVDTFFVNGAPRISKNLSIFKNRMFVTYDLMDFDDDSSFSLTPSTELYTYTKSALTHKPFATYQIGIQFFDKYGRSNGVQGQVKAEMPDYSPFAIYDVAEGNTGAAAFNPRLRNLKVAISGTAPSWAVTYQIALKQTSVEQFIVTNCNAMFYKRDDDGSAIAAGEIRESDKVYFNDHQSGWTDNIYLKIPKNLPFTVTSKYYVRLLEDYGQTKSVEPVIAFDGDKVIVKNFGITDWTVFDTKMMVEIFIPKESDNDIFDLVGKRYSIATDGFNALDLRVPGDVWFILEASFTPGFENEAWEFNPVDEGTVAAGYTVYEGVTGANYLSQSPTKSNVIKRDNITERELLSREDAIARAKELNPELFSGDKAGIYEEKNWKLGPAGWIVKRNQNNAIKEASIKEIIKSPVIETRALDYTKIMNDQTGISTIIVNQEEKSMPTTVGYSDTVIPGTLINGLSSISPLNNYTIPTNRTDIRKMVEVRDVLLLIHERSATSLYIGEGFIRTSEGQTLMETSGVITESGERELKGGYGTVHPESVIEHNEKVFWFDANKGEIVRYDRNGVTPLGEFFKMKSYLKIKGEQYIDSGSVISGYDPYLNIVYFTFKANGQIESETIAFIDRENEKGFLGFFDFFPDYYAKINNQLYMFINGHAALLSDIVNYNRFISNGTGDIPNEHTFFDGVNDYISFASPISTGSFVEFDIRVTFVAYSLTNVALFGYQNGANFSYCLIENSTTVKLLGSISGDTATFSLSEPLVANREYTLRLFRPNSTDVILYINSEVQGSQPFSDEIAVSWIGGVNTLSVYFHGYIDSFSYDNPFDAYNHSYNTETNWLDQSSIPSAINGTLNGATILVLYYLTNFGSSLRFVANPMFSMEKIWRSLSVESNYPWVMTTLSNEHGQDSELLTPDFKRRGNTFFADFLRDKNTPLALLSGNQAALMSGDEIISKKLEVTLVNDDAADVEIQFVNIGFERKTGTQII